MTTIPKPGLYNLGYINPNDNLRTKQGLQSQRVSSACNIQNTCGSVNLFNAPVVELPITEGAPSSNCPCLVNFAKRVNGVCN